MSDGQAWAIQQNTEAASAESAAIDRLRVIAELLKSSSEVDRQQLIAERERILDELER